jgi:hypothetical protein
MFFSILSILGIASLKKRRKSVIANLLHTIIFTFNLYLLDAYAYSRTSLHVAQLWLKIFLELLFPIREYKYYCIDPSFYFIDRILTLLFWQNFIDLVHIMAHKLKIAYPLGSPQLLIQILSLQ